MKLHPGMRVLLDGFPDRDKIPETCSPRAANPKCRLARVHHATGARVRDNNDPAQSALSVAAHPQLPQEQQSDAGLLARRNVLGGIWTIGPGG
jgi:hypothetical protein